MLTLQARPERSRFTAIADLARCVIDAPTGPEGIPCVFAQLSRSNGAPVLVAKTRDETMDAQLILADRDPDVLKSSFDYLTERLKAIGLNVVDSEDKLQRLH